MLYRSGDLAKSIIHPQALNVSGLLDPSLSAAVLEHSTSQLSIIMPESFPGENTRRVWALNKRSSASILDAGILSVLLFRVSNNLLEIGMVGNGRYRHHVSDAERDLLAGLLKRMATSGLDWKHSITTDDGHTSSAIIEKLFEFAIHRSDEDLVKIMLELGADPNQQIKKRSHLTVTDSALNTAIRTHDSGIFKLLIEVGAVPDQSSLLQAIIQKDLKTADDIFRSKPSLDVNFNYVKHICFSPWKFHQDGCDVYFPIRTDRATLADIILFSQGKDYGAGHRCTCAKFSLISATTHQHGCPLQAETAALQYLLQREITVDVNTMIAAAWSGNVVAVYILYQNGVSADGFNSIGMSPLSVAVCNTDGDFETILLLLNLGAKPNLPRTHPYFGFVPSALHLMCCLCEPNQDILSLFYAAGADFNYYARYYTLEHASAIGYGKFRKIHGRIGVWFEALLGKIWSLKVETVLEYAIANNRTSVALGLINSGCILTGREMLLTAKLGGVAIVQALLQRDASPVSAQGEHGRHVMQQVMQHALRNGNSPIVELLIATGVVLQEEDILNTFQQFDRSMWYNSNPPNTLSIEIQIALIRATPNLDQQEFQAESFIGHVCRSFSKEAIHYMLSRYPTAYSSVAVCHAIHRRVRPATGLIPGDDFGTENFEDLTSRRLTARLDDVQENTAILVAAMYGRHDIVQMLISPRMALTMKTGTVPGVVISEFLQNATDPTGCRLKARLPTSHRLYGLNELSYLCRDSDMVECSPVMAAVMAESSSVAECMVEHLISCSYQMDTLSVLAAVVRDRMSILQRFQRLDTWHTVMGNDVRPSGCPSALQMAVFLNRIDMIQSLIEAGVSSNEPPATDTSLWYPARTAFQFAVEAGNVDLMNMLIGAGADINAPAAPGEGATALQIASIKGYLGIARYLIESGADVNAPRAEREGRTALEGAAEHGRLDMLQLLLLSGADIGGAYREQYVRAVLLAERESHSTAARLLRQEREWTIEDHKLYEERREVEDWLYS